MGRPNPVPKNDPPTTPEQRNQIAARLARGLGKTSSNSPARNDENAPSCDPHRFHNAAAILEKKIRGPRAELFNPAIVLSPRLFPKDGSFSIARLTAEETKSRVEKVPICNSVARWIFERGIFKGSSTKTDGKSLDQIERDVTEDLENARAALESVDVTSHDALEEDSDSEIEFADEYFKNDTADQVGEKTFITIPGVSIENGRLSIGNGSATQLQLPGASYKNESGISFASADQVPLPGIRSSASIASNGSDRAIFPDASSPTDDVQAGSSSLGPYNQLLASKGWAISSANPSAWSLATNVSEIEFVNLNDDGINDDGINRNISQEIFNDTGSSAASTAACNPSELQVVDTCRRELPIRNFAAFAENQALQESDSKKQKLVAAGNAEALFAPIPETVASDGIPSSQTPLGVGVQGSSADTTLDAFLGVPPSDAVGTQ